MHLFYPVCVCARAPILSHSFLSSQIPSICIRLGFLACYLENTRLVLPKKLSELFFQRLQTPPKAQLDCNGSRQLRPLTADGSQRPTTATPPPSSKITAKLSKLYVCRARGEGVIEVNCNNPTPLVKAADTEEPHTKCLGSLQINCDGRPIA